MAYSESAAERVYDYLMSKELDFYQKRMMGGLVFMVNEKMCVGLVGNQLMCRIHPDFYESALEKEHAHPMNFTGRSMKGFIFVTEEGYDFDEDLCFWIEKCLEFNPFAKISRKRKK